MNKLRTILLAVLTVLVLTAAWSQTTETAIFAGGRFWSLQAAFENVYGVISVTAGYTGGSTRTPTEESYADGGHVQAVRIVFDPTRVDYEELLEEYWFQTDPTDPDGQFTDRGPQFRPVIYHVDAKQRKAAEASKQAVAMSGRFADPVVTEIRKAAAFHPADGEQQGYARLNAASYTAYLTRSGRKDFFDAIWGTEARMDPAAPPSVRREFGKPSSRQLKETLSALQYEVTQQNGTERSYRNEYWDNHEEGLYVDVVSGEPLFSSRDKYDSRTGWPSFTRPLAPSNIVIETDTSYGMVRMEVRSRFADSHLGHLFEDGPAPTGLRYCMNSAALRFIPVDELEGSGYGRYLDHFLR